MVLLSPSISACRTLNRPLEPSSPNLDGRIRQQGRGVPRGKRAWTATPRRLRMADHSNRVRGNTSEEPIVRYLGQPYEGMGFRVLLQVRRAITVRPRRDSIAK